VLKSLAVAETQFWLGVFPGLNRSAEHPVNGVHNGTSIAFVRRIKMATA
jgi:hypothetical protein